MLIVCWEDVTEETVKKCFAKFCISPKVHNNAQNELDDMFIELRGTMEKLKCLGIDEIPEELNLEELANFNDTFAAAEPFYLMDQCLQWCMKSINQTKSK